MTETISTVVLDLDDTLIASTRARRRAYQSLREQGIDPRAAEAANTRWWERYHAGDCSLEQMRQGRWIELGLSPEEAIRIDERYRAHYENIRARLGARRLLERLRESNLNVVLLSNAGIEYVRDRVAALRVEHLLNGVVDVTATRWKPHPEAFQTALALVGESPARAAMVGDNLDADVNGALAAGFRHVVWLTRRKPHTDARVACLPSLAATEAHLLALAGQNSAIHAPTPECTSPA
jgi:HAD superfamily hydrolase (TIGR01509 family)